MEVDNGAFQRTRADPTWRTRLCFSDLEVGHGWRCKLGIVDEGGGLIYNSFRNRHHMMVRSEFVTRRSVRYEHAMGFSERIRGFNVFALST